MARDKRYKTVGFLIQAGHVKSFSEVFEHMPKSIIYTDMGWNYNRFQRLINSPSLFTLKDLTTLASLFGIDPRKMIDLALEDINKKKK